MSPNGPVVMDSKEDDSYIEDCQSLSFMSFPPTCLSSSLSHSSSSNCSSSYYYSIPLPPIQVPLLLLLRLLFPRLTSSHSASGTCIHMLDYNEDEDQTSIHSTNVALALNPDDGRRERYLCDSKGHNTLHQILEHHEYLLQRDEDERGRNYKKINPMTAEMKGYKQQGHLKPCTKYPIRGPSQCPQKWSNFSLTYHV